MTHVVMPLRKDWGDSVADLEECDSRPDSLDNAGSIWSGQLTSSPAIRRRFGIE